MYKALDELHKIREKIYEEEKGLSDKKALERLHKRVEKIIKERNLEFRRPEKEILRKAS